MIESTVYLKRVATGDLVEASYFDEVTDAHLGLWQSSWCPVMQAHCAGRDLADKPQDHHWDWRKKTNACRPILGYHSAAIVCAGQLQGLMLANDFRSARIQSQFGKPIIYIEYLATAPWNRPEIASPPAYSGVGTVFIGAAIQLSIEMHYAGRIGLYSLPQAERFYRDKCSMTELGRDSANHKLMYYEMTEQQADAFGQLGRQ
jgi:hypothetical protein